jgi:hypothetical protein
MLLDRKPRLKSTLHIQYLKDAPIAKVELAVLVEDADET